MVNGAEANILSFSIFTYRCGSMFQLEKVQLSRLQLNVTGFSCSETSRLNQYNASIYSQNSYFSSLYQHPTQETRITEPSSSLRSDNSMCHSTAFKDGQDSTDKK